MNRLRLVSVMPKVFAQASDQVPDPGDEQRRKNRPADKTKRLPQRWLDHGNKERREKQRHRGENGSLPRRIFAPIVLQDLIDDSIPTSLRGDVAGALRVRIVGLENRRAVSLLGELLIVKRPLLRINQRVIGEREQRELTRSFLGISIDVWMPFAGQLAIGGFDLTSGCRWLNAQDLIIIGHRKGIVSGRYATSAY